MPGYGQFCPVAQAAEVLAERWTPLVVRELLYGSTRFNEIQRGVPLMSSSLLSKRLQSLERAGIVERRPDARGAGEYRLTPAGEGLRPIVEMMGFWGERWLRREIVPEDADPAYLMWTVRTIVDREAMPSERTVVHFRFAEAPDAKRYWWLVLRRPEVDLCLSDPGFGDDLTVRSTPTALAVVVVGDVGLAGALRRRELELEGPGHLVRGFASWFGISPFASARSGGRGEAAQPAAASR